VHSYTGYIVLHVPVVTTKNDLGMCIILSMTIPSRTVCFTTNTCGCILLMERSFYVKYFTYTKPWYFGKVSITALFLLVLIITMYT